MNRSSFRRGSTLIEIMLAGMAALMVGAALIILVQTSYSSQQITVQENLAYVTVRKTLDTLTDHLRNAQENPVSSTYCVFSAATSNSITLYTDTSQNTERYYIDTATSPYSLKRTQTVSGVATTTVILSGINSMTFTYYLPSGSTYNAATWNTTANPNAPTSTELPNVAAVGVSVNVTVGSCTRTITTFVRLRNSPYRS